MAEKKSFNYYRSFYDISVELDKERFYDFNMALFQVLLYEKHIDEIEFDDFPLRIAWKSVKHSLKSSIDGFCSKKGINYNKKFHTLTKGVGKCKESSHTLANNVKEKGKEKDKEKDKDKENEEERIPYVDIVNDLNKKAGTNFRSTTEKTRRLIRARFNEGFEAHDFVTVNSKKCEDWLNNPKYAKFLRPETLYGTKFEGYLNQKQGFRNDEWDFDANELLEQESFLADDPKIVESEVVE